MTKFARIQNNVAVDVIDGDPSAFFHPDLVASFVEVAAAVQLGWIFDPVGSVWSAPPAPAVTGPSYRTEVSRPEFKMLFTSAERIAIAQARAGGASDAEKLVKAVLDDFFDIIEDPALSSIRLEHPTVQEGIAFLVAQGFLTQERADIIVLGIEL